MRTILVPTDFSKLSRVGLSHAIKLAKKIQARVIVITVVTEVSGDPTERPDVKKYQASMLSTAQSDGEKFLKEFKSEAAKIDIAFKPVAGFPVVDVIEKFAVENKVDLIVMGSKGATGLKKIIMGSNASAVIDNSSVPVLVIPGEANTKAGGKLVYATDATDFQSEVKIVASFAQLLSASMEVVHVVPKGKPTDKDPSGVTTKKLKEIAAYPKMHLHVIRDKSVAAGLETFIKSQKEDFVLVTFTHKLSFNEKLFGKSVTQKLAFYNSVPLLAVNKSNQRRA